jgi:hypothetical protein
MSEETEGRCKMVAKESESEQVSEAAKEPEEKRDNTPIKALSPDAIMQSDDVEIVELYVEQWGGTVYVRSLSCAERDRVEKWIREHKDVSGFNVFMAILTTCNESGDALFSDNDASWLEKKSSKVLDKIAKIAVTLSGLGKEEEASADFTNDQSDDSGSS